MSYGTYRNFISIWGLSSYCIISFCKFIRSFKDFKDLKRSKPPLRIGKGMTYKQFRHNKTLTTLAGYILVNRLKGGRHSALITRARNPTRTKN
jgi:hypothetical protein